VELSEFSDRQSFARVLDSRARAFSTLRDTERERERERAFTCEKFPVGGARRRESRRRIELLAKMRLLVVALEATTTLRE
jgi:hypothetical protein